MLGAQNGQARREDLAIFFCLLNGKVNRLGYFEHEGIEQALARELAKGDRFHGCLSHVFRPTKCM